MEHTGMIDKKNIFSVSGFTLIELIITLVLLSAVLAIVLLRFPSSGSDKFLAYTSSKALAGYLRLAKRLAVSTDRVHFVKLDGGSYTIVRINDDSSENVVEGPVIFDGRINYTTSSDTFAFNQLGEAVPGGNINVSCGGFKYKILVISPTGYIKLEKG